MYYVEKIDYEHLVTRMWEVGMEKMAEILEAQLKLLPSPKWENEKAYFWRALFNAARSNDAVWLWLVTQPHIRHYAPPEAQFHTSGQFCSELELPVIGGPDDRPAKTPTPSGERYKNIGDYIATLVARIGWRINSN